MWGISPSLRVIVQTSLKKRAALASCYSPHLAALLCFSVAVNHATLVKGSSRRKPSRTQVTVACMNEAPRVMMPAALFWKSNMVQLQALPCNRASTGSCVVLAETVESGVCQWPSEKM